MLTTAARLCIGMAVIEALKSVLVVFRYLANRDKPYQITRRLENGFIFVAYAGGMAVLAIQIWITVVLEKAQGQAKVVEDIGLSKGRSEAYMKVSFASDLLFTIILWCIKACFLVGQYDLCRSLSRFHKVMFFITALYLLLSFAVSFFASFIYCRDDLDTLWSYTAYCSALNSNAFVSVQYFLNIGGDLLIIGSYILFLRHLQLSRPAVVAFWFVVFLGVITMTASSIGFANLFHINNLPDGQDANDELFEDWTVWMYTEFSTGFVACCLPPLRKYVRDKLALERSRKDSCKSDKSEFSSGRSNV